MEFQSGNIFVRPMSSEGFELGQIVEGHEHTFDHTTIFFIGRWRVKKWKPIVDEDGTHVLDSQGKKKWLLVMDNEYEAPHYLLIDEGVLHSFEFLGVSTPDWMVPFIIPEKVEEFKATMNKTLGKVWCVYSHRNAQGDVVQVWDGWMGAYI